MRINAAKNYDFFNTKLLLPIFQVVSMQQNAMRQQLKTQWLDSDLSECPDADDCEGAIIYMILKEYFGQFNDSNVIKHHLNCRLIRFFPR